MTPARFTDRRILELKLYQGQIWMANELDIHRDRIIDAIGVADKLIEGFVGVRCILSGPESVERANTKVFLAKVGHETQISVQFRHPFQAGFDQLAGYRYSFRYAIGFREFLGKRRWPRLPRGWTALSAGMTGTFVPSALSDTPFATTRRMPTLTLSPHSTPLTLRLRWTSRNQQEGQTNQARKSFRHSKPPIQELPRANLSQEKSHCQAGRTNHFLNTILAVGKTVAEAGSHQFRDAQLKNILLSKVLAISCMSGTGLRVGRSNSLDRTRSGATCHGIPGALLRLRRNRPSSQRILERPGHTLFDCPRGRSPLFRVGR